MADDKGDSNAADAAFAAAERRKSEGNRLFETGRHQEAAEFYKEALNGLENLALDNREAVKSTTSLTLRSNLAACFLATEHYEQATSESEAALKLDPLHIKSRLRLAKALHSLGRVRDAAETMAVAVALLSRLDVETTRLYDEIAEQSSTLLDFNLPVDPTSIVGVASSHDFGMALAMRKLVVVFKPGSYCVTLQHCLMGPLSLIGIGKVEIVSYSHSLYVADGHVFASHLKLITLSMRSAACVDRDARLTLVDCQVHDLRDVGLLAQGEAVIERCSFRNLKKQAVEVRMGGSVKLRGCLIRDCLQGICAYGGARRVEIINCEISQNQREGILANGENWNAATRAQIPFSPTLVSIAALLWAQEARVQLEVVISSSVVKDNGHMGLSLDLGAEVSVVNSVLLNNAPFACFIKGATNALVSGCHIECRKGLEGVHVGVNYEAKVTVSGTTFVVGDNKSAVVEEMSTSFEGAEMRQMLLLTIGAWSRPVLAKANKIFVDERSSGSGVSSSLLPSIPTLESLAAKEAAEHQGIRKSNKGAAAPSDSSPRRDLHALTRPCRQMCKKFTKSLEYYAIGNTFGHDLSLGQTMNAMKVNVFLGACGDIRNLLKTVTCMRLPSHVQMKMVLNDSNMSILARNIVLLTLIARGASGQDTVALWANHRITVAQRALLESVLDDLRLSWPEWLTLPVEAESQISEIFSAWRDCTMLLNELLDLHRHMVTLNRSMFESAVKLAEDAVGHRQFNKEIREHIQSGNFDRVTDAMTEANPLMLEAPSLQYLLYWSSSIYRAIQIQDEVKKASRIEELHGVLLRTLTPQIEAVAEALKGNSLHVAVVPGDVLDALLYDETQGPNPALEFFDFMDLSNVSDYVSLPAIVQAALPRLKVVSHARVHIQSMQWCSLGFSDPTAFLRHSIGMELETYQELLGVSVCVGPMLNQGVLNTQWAWNFRESSSWLTGATVLLDIMAAAKLHCAIDRVTNLSSQRGFQSRFYVPGALAGLDCSSPVTLFHLLYLTCPASLLMPLLRVLVGTEPKRKWELLGHAMIQTDPLKSQQTFCRVEFKATADYYALLECANMTLCVVVSSVPFWQGEEIPSDSVVQLIEAFAYCSKSDCVEFLLWRAFVEDPKWKCHFVSLCVVADGTRLRAVGVSVAVDQLAMDSLVESPLPIWTTCERRPPWLSHDATLVEMLSKRTAAKPEAVPTWTTHAVRETSTVVVVELLLPRPFPSAEEATLEVSCTRETMKIIVKARVVKKKSKKNKTSKMEALSKKATAHIHEGGVSGFAFPEQHIIEFPVVVSTRGHIIKLSKQLGLMIVRVPKI